MSIRKDIIAARDRMGWSDLRLSQEAGVTYSRLHEWLSDPDKPQGITSANLEKIAAALGFDIGLVRPTKRSKPKK